MIKLIAFDGDDTLWHHDNIFFHTRKRYAEIMAHYNKSENAEDAVSQAQINNLNLYGYGVKGFILSMIEESIHATDGRITTKDIETLINLGKDMLRSPVMLCNTVKETILHLSEAQKYQLIIITKGDLHDQEYKIEQSGLGEHFAHHEIVSEKNKDTYAAILKKYAVTPSEFLMVGNSPKSDILPVLEIGAHAIHVPYFTTWKHERIDENKNHPTYPTVKHMIDILPIIKAL